MSLTPTPVTAALSGVFSGLAWPLLWPLVNGAGASATVGLVLGTVGLIALPAHAFVVGFKPQQTARAGSIDAALLVRVSAWLACAAITAVLVSVYRGSA